MLPLTAAFETVAQMFSTNTFNEQEAKVRQALAGCLQPPRPWCGVDTTQPVYTHPPCAQPGDFHIQPYSHSQNLKQAFWLGVGIRSSPGGPADLGQ